MHVLVATTGAMSPEPVAEITSRFLTNGGKVSVVTVVEVPRSFLDAIRSEEWHPLTDSSWAEHQDALIARYVEERGRRVTEPVASALAGRGLDVHARFLEGEDPAATIIKTAVELDVDLVILGATRQIFDEAAWESVSARVMRDTVRPVLVVPSQAGAVPSDAEYRRPDDS